MNEAARVSKPPRKWQPREDETFTLCFFEQYASLQEKNGFRPAAWSHFRLCLPAQLAGHAPPEPGSLVIRITYPEQAGENSEVAAAWRDQIPLHMAKKPVHWSPTYRLRASSHEEARKMISWFDSGIHVYGSADLGCPGDMAYRVASHPALPVPGWRFYYVETVEPEQCRDVFTVAVVEENTTWHKHLPPYNSAGYRQAVKKAIASLRDEGWECTYHKRAFYWDIFREVVVYSPEGGVA